MATDSRVNGTRQDTFIVTLKVGTVSYGVWDKKTGGAVDSDDIKYFPGGMLPPISLGGKRTTDNVTLQRNYDRVDDHNKIEALLAAAGRGAVVITQRPMDPDGNPSPGKAIQWIGKLKRVEVPDVDSESTTASLITIEATVSGYPSLA